MPRTKGSKNKTTIMKERFNEVKKEIKGLSQYEQVKRWFEEFGSINLELAKEKYGGRLLLKPENKNCNPSVFYYKCGLLSTTKKGAQEINDFIEFGKQIQSGYSDAMYLPVI